MKRSIRQRLEQRKRRIERRLARRRRRRAKRTGFTRPVMDTRSIKYELSQRSRGVVYGGVALLHRLANDVGLVKAINDKVNLLKLWLPYSEADHVLNFAFNGLCEGTCLEDIELRRNDEAFLDALGAETIPDPTTAGDFCRRFKKTSVRRLLDAINEARLNVWARQDDEFFEEAVLDADGTLVITGGECKGGMDISYKGTWGYHPLLVSLANTGEPLSIINRSGNRPSEDGAAAELDRAIALCRQAGFRKVRLRGDTAFSQTEHLDGWDAEGVVFQFGYNAYANLEEIAENLPESVWTKLRRPPKYEVQTGRRRKPRNVKRRVVRQREYLHLELKGEQVAEFDYRPTACQKTYRMVVVKKEHLPRERGGGAVRGDPLPVLHHQRPGRVVSCGDRLRLQRSLRPGEPDRATGRWGAGAGRTGGPPRLELGLHGDDQSGVDPQGLGGVVVADAWSLDGATPAGSSSRAADGVRSVSTSRSSNRTCGFPASGFRTRTHAFAHGKLRLIRRSRTSPSSR